MKNEKKKEKKYYIIKNILFISLFSFFFLLSSFVINAQESDTDPVSYSFFMQSAYPLGVKLGYTFGYKFPFMQGESPLTEDNNIKFELTAEASPVSINGLAKTIWTPIAFLEFTAGGRVGSGWNINLFGGDIYGIGLNRNSGVNDIAENSGRAFDGLLYKALMGGAFQFDLAALFPGDWNHIVFRTYHEIYYHGYSRAKHGESWYFEHTTSENVNGFVYYSCYLVGYQMPLLLNMIAFMAEAEKNFYDIPNKEIWGEDLMLWILSAILNFEINKKTNITAIAQFNTVRNYLEQDTKDKYYRSLTVDRSNPLRLEFYQVALIANYKF